MRGADSSRPLPDRLLTLYHKIVMFASAAEATASTCQKGETESAPADAKKTREAKPAGGPSTATSQCPEGAGSPGGRAFASMILTAVG